MTNKIFGIVVFKFFVTGLPYFARVESRRLPMPICVETEPEPTDRGAEAPRRQTKTPAFLAAVSLRGKNAEHSTVGRAGNNTVIPVSFTSRRHRTAQCVLHHLNQY